MRRFATLLRFVFAALPGAVLMLVIGPALVAPAMGPHVPPRAFAIPAGVAAIAVGAAMILYGTNRWGRWLSLLPLAALEVWVVVGLDPGAGRATFFILLILPFVLAMAVRRYQMPDDR